MSQPLPFKSALACRNAVIERLLDEIGQQQRLLDAIREALPEHLRPRVCHARWDSDSARLLIHADAAVWATQLRFYSEMIKARLQSTFGIAAIRQVQVRILVGPSLSLFTSPPTPRPSPLAVPEENADAALERALQRLNSCIATRSRRRAEL